MSVVALSRSLKTALLPVNRLIMYTVTERCPGWYNAKKTPTYPRSLSDTDEGRSPHTMPRIAQKELYVNSKMTDDYIIYNPGWGSMHIDSVTNEMAQLYDHVKRSMKFSGGYQVWIYVPRYKLVNSGTLFRVLPPNLCPNKHYVVEEIQDVLDGSVEVILGSQEGEIKQAEENKKVESAEGENDRPCEKTKWLWLLWFVKNVVLIEAVLRFIAYNSTISMPVSEGKIAAVIGYQDYLQDLRTNEPESWLKMVINAAWNIGRSLVPLRNCQSIESVLHYAKVTP